MTWSSIPQHLINQVNEILEDLKRYDISTYNHCVRVSHLCRFLAEAAELTEYEQLQAQFSGILHDVGKMRIPLDILNKPGKLDNDEYEMMQKHPIYSAEMLEPLKESQFFREVQLAILHHHERVDGRGYPFGLKGEQIPYISKLTLVVDTVDAMTQTRAYRKGLPMKVVYQELEKCSGTQFDSELVNIFNKPYKELFQNNDPTPVITLPKRVKAV